MKAATAAAEGQGGGGSAGVSGSGGSNGGVALGSSGSADSGSGGASGSAGGSGGTGGSSGGALGGASGGGGSSGGAGSSTGGATSGGGGGRAGTQGTTATTAPGAALPPGGNGGSTDVGVTATSITVGNVSDLGGPVPGLFQGGPDGTQAYFAYINSQGGVFGRKLQLAAADDQLQCSQNESDYQDEVGKVFAFVGSWSLDDNCGAQIMQSHTNIPMVQTYLSPQMGNLPNAFAEAPYTVNVPTGPFLYFKGKFPDAIGSVGTIVGNQPSAVAAWDHAKQAITSLGYKVIYEDDFPPAQSNFTADVIRMKAAGVKMVFMIAVNGPDAAIFASEAAQQGFTPEVYLCPVCYAGTYIDESGGASSVNKQWAYVSTADFLNDPGVPEVALFEHWIHVAYPNFVPDEFAAYSWANAALFVHALQQAGPHLTRQAVLNALKGIDTWTDNGMITAAKIGARQASQCYNLLQIQNGQFVKVDDPSTGFRCDGQLIP